MRWTTILLIAAIVVAAACARSSQIRDVSIDDLHAALGKSDTVVLQIRGNFALSDKRSTLPGAVQLSLDDLGKNLDQVRKEANVYIISEKEQQTINAANILARAKYPFIYRVQGGLSAYLTKYPYMSN